VQGRCQPRRSILQEVELIRENVEAACDASLPSSASGNAASNTLAHWKKLTRFREHGELELGTIWRRTRCVP
jgi:hypothetical protein